MTLRILSYILISQVSDRNPVGRIAEQQRIAEYMFRPEGIFFDFGKGIKRYLCL